MKSFNQIKCMLFLAVLWVCPAAFAKDYIVEMVFFANAQDYKESSLRAQPPIAHPDLQGAILLDDSAVFHDFLPLPKDALQLHAQVDLLETSAKYRILKHVAWLQPGFDKENAIPVHITAGIDYSSKFGKLSPATDASSSQPEPKKDPVHELDGTVKIVLGRYLHVFTDLVYRRPFKTDPENEPDTAGQDFTLAEFSLKTHRKMRSQELHYIDHPWFGILVKIFPVEYEN